jgi:hypothetical protein
MLDELLEMLLDCLEGRRPHAEWTVWWEAHESRVEAECGRFLYLRLKRRGLGVAKSILEAHGRTVQWRPGYCRRCGEPTFVAIPGKTTKEEIRSFAAGSRIPGWEGIVKDGWIHPGEYCVNHGTLALWEMADAIDEAVDALGEEQVLRMKN